MKCCTKLKLNLINKFESPIAIYCWQENYISIKKYLNLDFTFTIQFYSASSWLVRSLGASVAHLTISKTLEKYKVLLKFNMFPNLSIYYSQQFVFHFLLLSSLLLPSLLFYFTLFSSFAFYSILLYSILLPSILFYFILFSCLLFYSTLFYSLAFYSILFSCLLFYSFAFSPILLYSILLPSILFYFILYSCLLS